MSEGLAVREAKVTSAQLGRRAVVYVRQSTPGQVATNLESVARQYALADRAVALVAERRPPRLPAFRRRPMT